MGPFEASRDGGTGRARRLVGALTGLIAMALAWLQPVAAAYAQDRPLTLIRDAEIEETLRLETDPILVAAGLDPKAVRIHIVGDKELNAFVAGGQRIFLFTGMIVETKDPGELKGVIAHETGHIAGGHLARLDIGAQSAMKTFLLTLGLGVVAALAGAPDVGGAIAMSAGQFATLGMLGYTRVQEAQADQAAATYLEKAGMSGKGLVSFFENFRYEELFSNARRYAYFQSHPLSSQRIEALRVRVEKLPHFTTEEQAAAIERHKVMVAKLKAFINYPQQTFQDYPESDPSFAAKYARAIAYYKATDTTRALSAIDALIQEHPDNPFLWELKGQVLFETGRIKEAEAPQRQALSLRPDATLLQLSLGQTLVSLNDKSRLDEAIQRLKTVTQADREDAMAWRLLSRAYDAQGLDGMARLAAAEQYYAVGAVDQARIFGMRARELLTKGTPEWRRATDIVLVSNPSKADIERLSLAQAGAR